LPLKIIRLYSKRLSQQSQAGSFISAVSATKFGPEALMQSKQQAAIF